jgi:hypothetical protein
LEKGFGVFVNNVLPETSAAELDRLPEKRLLN